MGILSPQTIIPILLIPYISQQYFIMEYLKIILDTTNVRAIICAFVALSNGEQYVKLSQIRGLPR